MNGPFPDKSAGFFRNPQRPGSAPQSRTPKWAVAASSRGRILPHPFGSSVRPPLRSCGRSPPTVESPRQCIRDGREMHPHATRLNPQRRRSAKKACGLPIPQNAATFWRMDSADGNGLAASSRLSTCAIPSGCERSWRAGLTFITNSSRSLRIGGIRRVLSPRSGRAAGRKAVHAGGRQAANASRKWFAWHRAPRKSRSRASARCWNPSSRMCASTWNRSSASLPAAKAVGAEDDGNLRKHAGQKRRLVADFLRLWPAARAGWNDDHRLPCCCGRTPASECWVSSP